MRRIKVNASFERQLLIGMIVSTSFLHAVKHIYKEEFIQNRLVREIASWCLEYYNVYDKAPHKYIENIFESKEPTMDEKMLAFIQTILDSLSVEWAHVKKFNVEYLLDQCEREFNLRKAENLKQAVDEAITNKDVRQVNTLVNSYAPVEKNRSDGMNPFNSMDAVKRAFTEAQEPLFKVTGSLGKLLNKQMVRGGFVGFMGAEKSGKSHTLQDLLMVAHAQGNNVALFEVGDMTEGQRLSRILGYCAGRPVEPITIVNYPIIDCVNNQNDTCDKKDRISKIGLPEINFDVERGVLARTILRINKAGYKPCFECKGENRSTTFNFVGTVWYEPTKTSQLTWIEAYREGKRWDRKAGKHFRLSVHESDSINIRQIGHKLDEWEKRYGFVADVIGIDYPDILAPEDANKSERGVENDRWKGIRKLTQQRHALGLVVTQADANSYGKDSLDLSNFSEDKRKFAHVTAFYSINQNEEESNRGIIRIGEMLVREQKRRKRKVKVIQCLDLNKPHVMSF